MIIEGINAVTEALSGEMTIEKVLVTKTAQNPRIAKIVAMAKKNRIKVFFEDGSRLDKMSTSNNHQGVMAVATEFQYTEIEDILDAERTDPLLLVLLDGIEDPHNVGAVIRVVDSVGGAGIVLPKHRSASVNDTVIRTSAGAASHVAVAKVTNINDVIRDLVDRGITVLAADMGGSSVYDTDLTGDIAIVIGGEGSGVHTLTKKLSSGIISLPQLGAVNSLNASVATGVMLYEAIRQRKFKR
ncbi:MAG: 23S rRNA (guanosine(2251)-2'-O)-methyltransferase RlmB [Bacillota bacterium]